MFIGDDRQIGRINRGMAGVVPEPPGRLLGRDPAPETAATAFLRYRPIARYAARSAGPELGEFQHVAPDGPAHVGRRFQPDRSGAAERSKRRIRERQFFANQVVARLAERIAVAARPVEPPVFPVVDPHPDRPIGPDKLGVDANAVPLQLVDRDLACHFGADRRTVAVNFQLFHVQRKHDVAFGEIIEAPCTEQLGEVIDNDQVGVERRRLPCS